MDSRLLVAGLLALTVVLVVGVWLAVRRRASRDVKGRPIIVFKSGQGHASFTAVLPEPLPHLAAVESVAPPDAAPQAWSPTASGYGRGAQPAPGPVGPPPAVRPHDGSGGAPFRPENRPPAREVVGAGPRLVGNASRLEALQAIPGVESVPDGTLQLLPGRITVLTEEGRTQEVRFVRVPGTPPEVSFGRSSGPAHRHVQLDSPTVSRLHARLRFDGGGWLLSNLSRTNPTRLNGQALAGDAVEHPVRDGDRIEMGDVTLEFHQPETLDRLPMRSSWASETGLRSTNQDAVAVRTLPERRELAAVCDGVGSHKAGARASHTAIEAVVRALTERKDLPGAIRAANDAVRHEARADAALKGMATTMVALLREEDHYWVGNVGDSRAYRIDASGIRQITHDHSFIAEAMRAGEMSRDEAERSPWRNAITRNLGGEDAVEVDLFGAFSTAEPHIVVLCTDGLHGVLSEQDLERTVLGTGDVREIARALCDEAIRRGSKDNVTVAALAFGGGIARPGTPPR